MRIILRVFLVNLLVLALVMHLAGMGDPDCLRIPTYDFTGIVDLKFGYMIPHDLTIRGVPYGYYNTAPNKQYLGYFQGPVVPNDDSTYEFRITAVDALGRPVGKPRVLHQNMPVPRDAGGAYIRSIVDAVWLPDSQHILLYWLPDYYSYYSINGNPPKPVTRSIHQFAVVDVYGNVVAKRTIEWPLIYSHPGAFPELHDYLIEGISPDGKIVAIRHGGFVELWSLSDLQPAALPIEVYPNSCHGYYNSADRCVDWSSKGSLLTVIGAQANGNPMIVIHDFEVNHRHTIPLPAAPYNRFLTTGWSPNDQYNVVSWSYEFRATQLIFDRHGNTAGILSNVAIEEGGEGPSLPKHNWTSDGNGLLYYDFEWDADGSSGHLFVSATGQSITLPKYIVNGNWFSGITTRGTNIALVWNDINEPEKTTSVNVGVVNTLTGTLTTLYTFNDRWLNQGEPLSLQWLSGTRLAVATRFAFAWGNADGTDWHSPTQPTSVFLNDSTFTGESVRGSQNVLVWNEASPQSNITAMKIGVMNSVTGTLTTLYTLNGQMINPYEFLYIHWLSDTRLMALTNFALVWGNTDGSDWHTLPEQLTIYMDTLTADGKSILITKPSEKQQNIYDLNLVSADVRLMLPSPAAALTMNGLGRTSDSRFIYRQLADSAGKSTLEVLDSLNNYTYTLDDALNPLWLPNQKQFWLVTGDAKQQQLRLFSAATGDLLRETTRVRAAWEQEAGNVSLGRCY